MRAAGEKWAARLAEAEKSWARAGEERVAGAVEAERAAAAAAAAAAEAAHSAKVEAAVCETMGVVISLSSERALHLGGSAGAVCKEAPGTGGGGC